VGCGLNERDTQGTDRLSLKTCGITPVGINTRFLLRGQ